MNRDTFNNSQFMFEGKILDFVGGLIIDLVKDQIKLHRTLKTSFLKMFNEAITMALGQLYPNQEEREEKWNRVITDISNHYFQGVGRFNELSKESQCAIILIVETLSKIHPEALSELSFFNNENRFDNIEEKLDIINKKIDNGTEKSLVSHLIKELFPYIEQQISELRFDVSLKLIEELRKKLLKQKEIDYDVLCRLDYYKSQCSYFIEPTRWQKEIDEAYTEMTKTNIYDKDIVSQFILSSVKARNKETAIKLANELKTRDRDSVYAWIPDFAFSENNKTNDIPDRLKQSEKFISLLAFANIDIYHWINLNNVNLDIPDTLVYDNFDIWLLKLNLLYINARRQSGLDFRCTGIIPPQYKKVLEISDKLLKILESKGLINWLPDVKWINAYLHFADEKDTKWINIFDNIRPTRQRTETYKVHKVLLRIGNRMFEDAKKAIMEFEQLDQEGIIDMAALFIYQLTNDTELAIKAFRLRVASGMPIPTLNIHYLLKPIIDNPDIFSSFVNKLVFEDEKTMIVFNAICNFFAGDMASIDVLAENEVFIHESIKYIVAQIYRNNGRREQALRLVKPKDGDCKSISSSLSYYISLLREKKEDSLELLSILKALRKNEIYNKDYLLCEGILYFERSEFEEAYNVMSLSWDRFSDDNHVFLNYLVALWKTRRYEQIRDLQGNALARRIESQYIKGIYNVFLTAGYPQTAIDILYKGIKENPNSQDLRDAFALESLSADSISAIICKGKSTVEENDYVQIEEEGQKKNVDAIIGSFYEPLIGKSMGDIVRIKHFNGVYRTIKIIVVFNKYYKLNQEIMKENEKGQSKAFYVFNIEGMDGQQIWDTITKISGDPIANRLEHQERVTNYANGRLTLINLMSPHSTLISFYDFVFGNEPKYITPKGDFMIRIGEFDITECEFVLDITSLVLLSELQKKYSLSFKKKFIVPNGLIDYVNISIDNDRVRRTTSMSCEAAQNLALSNYSGNQHVAKMEELLKWIDSFCIAETAEEITRFRHNDSDILFLVESESLLLSYKDHRIMLSEDNGIINMMPKFRIISTETFISILFPQLACGVSLYLAELHFINVNLSSNYIVQQYWERMGNKKNVFHECLKTIEGNKYIAGEVVNAATQIILSEIVLDSTLLTIQNMFVCMFNGMSKKDAIKIINLYRSLPIIVPAILTGLNDAFQIVYGKQNSLLQDI